MARVKGAVTCVRKHQEAFNAQARENAAAAREIEKGTAAVVSGIRAQERENAAAAREHQEAFKAQERENTVAVKEIEKGIGEVKAGIKAKTHLVEKAVASIHADIRQMERDTGKFIDLFYHGHVKGD